MNNSFTEKKNRKKNPLYENWAHWFYYSKREKEKGE